MPLLFKVLSVLLMLRLTKCNNRWLATSVDFSWTVVRFLPAQQKPLNTSSQNVIAILEKQQTISHFNSCL